MHVAAAEKACTCRSKGTKSEWIEKVYDYVLACNRLKGKISQMEVVEDFVSRPHKAVSFVVGSEKEMQEWYEQKLPKVLPGYSGGRLPRRSRKETRREEGELDEGTEERRIESEIAQEVVAGIKEKASVHEDVKANARRTAERSAKQNCIFRFSKMKQRRKMMTGKRKTRWKWSGMRITSWRRSWDEEEWKEAPSRCKSCKKHLN